MPARKTPEDYHKLATEKGIEWLGPQVTSIGIKTMWRCHCGREFESSYRNIYKNQGNCWECGVALSASTRRIQPDAYRDLASERGIEWIGPWVNQTTTKTQWRCHCGRLFWSTYRSVIITQGNCWECGVGLAASSRRIQPRSYEKVAKKRGFEWLGPVVNSIDTPTRWRCSEGHEWEAGLYSVRRGSGCPHCAGQTRKVAEDYYALAKDVGYQWLGPEVSNVDTKTMWLCPNGHQWEATYYAINGLKTGCPCCAGNIPKTPDDYHSEADKRGYKWLGPEVPNTSTKTTWVCEKGHTWEAAYSWIFSGQKTGCPKCKHMVNGQHTSQPQRDLHAMLEPFGTAVLNEPHERLNIDIGLTIGEVRIAVEYDCWYWHKDRLKKDARRDRKLIRDGWRVLRVKSSTSLPTKEQLETAVNELTNGRFYTEIVLPDWG